VALKEKEQLLVLKQTEQVFAIVKGFADWDKIQLVVLIQVLMKLLRHTSAGGSYNNYAPFSKLLQPGLTILRQLKLCYRRRIPEWRSDFGY
jgi:hypothetical protein